MRYTNEKKDLERKLNDVYSQFQDTKQKLQRVKSELEEKVRSNT